MAESIEADRIPEEDFEGELPEEGSEAQQRSSLGSTNMKRAKALVMLMQGVPVKDIAHLLRVHRTTVFRWTRTPEFQRELSFHRERLIEESFDVQALLSKRANYRLMELVERS